MVGTSCIAGCTRAAAFNLDKPPLPTPPQGVPRKEKSMTAWTPQRPAAARPSSGYVLGALEGIRSNAHTISCGAEGRRWDLVSRAAPGPTAICAAITLQHKAVPAQLAYLAAEREQRHDEQQGGQRQPAAAHQRVRHALPAPSSRRRPVGGTSGWVQGAA